MTSNVSWENLEVQPLLILFPGQLSINQQKYRKKFLENRYKISSNDRQIISEHFKKHFSVVTFTLQAAPVKNSVKYY